MRGYLHLGKRNESNVIRLAHYFKRPANTHVTRQSRSGDGSKAVMVGVI